MSETTYNAIRTGIRDYIVSNCLWATTANCFDYTPVDISTVFGVLPAVTVDTSPQGQVRWTPKNETYLKGIPFVIMIYEEITSDESHGRNASQEIAEKLKELEDLFISASSIGGLVKGSGIEESKIEALALQGLGTGIKARWAWLSIIVVVLGK